MLPDRDVSVTGTGNWKCQWLAERVCPGSPGPAVQSAIPTWDDTLSPGGQLRLAPWWGNVAPNARLGFVYRLLHATGPASEPTGLFLSLLATALRTAKTGVVRWTLVTKFAY